MFDTAVKMNRLFGSVELRQIKFFILNMFDSRVDIISSFIVHVLAVDPKTMCWTNYPLASRSLNYYPIGYRKPIP